MGFLYKLGLPRVNSLSFSLFLPLFFRLIPWNAEALHVYLFAWASKKHKREPKEGHTLLFKWVAVAYIDGASPLSQGFTGFLCKPRDTDSFLLSFLHNTILS